MAIPPELRRKLLVNGVAAVVVAAFAVWDAATGDLVGAAIVLGSLVVVVWWSWPTRGPHIDEAQALATAGPGDLILYWRPG